MDLLLLAGGFALLISGAEFLVRGASQAAAAIGISPLIIGLTVVAFGTSSPELAVSIGASFSGQADIAVGNVVGSNIFNVLFILGLSALVTPLVVSAQLVKLDVPIMISGSLAVLVMAQDGAIGRLDGLILLSMLFGYTLILIRQSRRDSQAQSTDVPAVDIRSKKFWLVNISRIIGGLVLLVLGSRLLVDSSVSIARYLGVSELVIGLTIVAVGTSLPEVATSIIASIRGERDIAVGNVVGSNIFNLMAVLGTTSVISAGGISISLAAMRFDIPVMTAVAIACLPIFFTGSRISRWEGMLFLGYYVAYTLFLALNATQNAALPIFNTAMMTFVIPLTMISLAVISIRALRARSRAAN